MSHTPGPWKLMNRVEAKKEGFSKTKHRSYISAIGRWWGLASVVTRMKGEEGEHAEGMANARLIAASPDLLEDAVETDKAYSWLVDQLRDFKMYGGSWTIEQSDNFAQSLLSHIEAHQIGTRVVIAVATGGAE